jgi:hypothetical protein
MALVDVIFSFLRETKNPENAIIAIDEPENSLHTSSGFEQFRKILKITEDAKCQVICTSHWYGFIPIISNGCIVYMDNSGAKPFNSEDFRPGSKKVPTEVLLKSGFELASSIIHSIKSENIHWILCEGSTDKLYLDSTLGKDRTFRILATSSDTSVISLYKQLSMSLKGENKLRFPGKVTCLIDTDADTAEKLKECNGFKPVTEILQLKRLNIISGELRLSGLDETKYSKCSIEDTLNPTASARTLNSLRPTPEEIEFLPRKDSKNLAINSQHPGITTKSETIGEVDGLEVSRSIIFGDSPDPRDSLKFKTTFSKKYVEELTEGEANEEQKKWKQFLG